MLSGEDMLSGELGTHHSRAECCEDQHVSEGPTVAQDRPGKQGPVNEFPLHVGRKNKRPPSVLVELLKEPPFQLLSLWSGAIMRSLPAI